MEKEITCGIALLYQKQTHTHSEQKIRCCLVKKETGDDHLDLKAKAERYFFDHPVQSKELEGFSMIAWNTAEPTE